MQLSPEVEFSIREKKSSVTFNLGQLKLYKEKHLENIKEQNALREIFLKSSTHNLNNDNDIIIILTASW